MRSILFFCLLRFKTQTKKIDVEIMVDKKMEKEKKSVTCAPLAKSTFFNRILILGTNVNTKVKYRDSDKKNT